VYFPFEVNSPNIKFAIFWQASQGFSIRILLFGYMELDLPTPVFHPPSWGAHLCSGTASPPLNMFVSISKMAKFGEITFNNEKTRETVATNSLLALNLKFYDSTGPMNSVSTVDLWQCSLSAKMQQILLMQMHL